MAAVFVPGIELGRRLHGEAVAPLLRARLPGVPYAAALLGRGSEVLGFDTARSTDHDWSARVLVFLGPGDAERHGPALAGLLARELPATFLGHPTRPVVAPLNAWLVRHLGFDPTASVGTADWLATPTQALAEFTGGAVYHDGLGGLTAARAALAWYPDDVWRYVLAAQWRRISEEEAFVGRTGEVGDELGSAVLAGRLVRDLLRLHLLLRRRYPPYGKWLGSAFAALDGAAALAEPLRAALAATDWRARERHLAAGYEAAAAAQNATGLAAAVDPATRPFHDRPYRVLHAERFSTALRAAIGDPALRARPRTGAIDQFVDGVAVLTDPGRARRIAGAV